MCASALRRTLTEARSLIPHTRRLRYLCRYSLSIFLRIILTLGVVRKIFENFLSSYRWRILSSRKGALRSSSKSKNSVCNVSYLSSVFSLRKRLLIYKANKMREIMSTLPAEVEAIIANLQKTYIDTSKDRGGVVKGKGKGKGRERTIQGALAELQL